MRDIIKQKEELSELYHVVLVENLKLEKKIDAHIMDNNIHMSMDYINGEFILKGDFDNYMESVEENILQNKRFIANIKENKPDYFPVSY